MRRSNRRNNVRKKDYKKIVIAIIVAVIIVLGIIKITVEINRKPEIVLNGDIKETINKKKSFPLYIFCILNVIVLILHCFNPNLLLITFYIHFIIKEIVKVIF